MKATTIIASLLLPMCGVVSHLSQAQIKDVASINTSNISTTFTPRSITDGHFKNCGGHKDWDYDPVFAGSQKQEWVPMYTFEYVMKTFCKKYNGYSIIKDEQVYIKYPVFLTNGVRGQLMCESHTIDRQFDTPAATLSSSEVLVKFPTLAAHQTPLIEIVHAYNDLMDGNYTLHEYECLWAMKVPLKMKNCYRKDTDDYQGGYYMVDNVGVIGSEVRVWTHPEPPIIEPPIYDPPI